MGNIHNKQEDDFAVDILLSMPDEARIWLRHHVRNCLQSILIGVEAKKPEIVENAATHLLYDMERIGC